MATPATKSFLFLCACALLTRAVIGQDDLCPAAEECHCYNAWEDEQVRADCLGDVRHVPSELPVNLTQLRISGSENFTHLLSNNMSKYDELNMVELISNALETIDSGAFNNLQNVEYLFITQNSLLKSLPSDILTPMSNLEFLDLLSNGFTGSIFGIFSGISSLKVVRMNYNPISADIPASAFGNNQDLETLYLTDCQVTGINANAFQNMNGLTSVYLDFNKITQLTSSAFSGLTKVDNLHLAFNQLTDLPANVFTEISTVTYLDLSHNNIASIDNNAFNNLPNLKTLNLDVNQLTVIPSTALKQITALDTINLSGNKFTSIPSNAFSGLHKLNSISLCDMPTLTIIETTAFNDVTNLTSLSLYNNAALTSLTPEHLPDAQHETLQILSITANAFRYLDAELFVNKPQLQRVDLTANPFHCDCDLAWMTEVYEDKLVWTRHWDSEGQIPIRCTTPKHLRDFKVLNMRSGDFTCDSPPELVRVSEGPTVVAYLNSDVIFEVHAHNGIPATRWRGPQGVEHIPVRPFPEGASVSDESSSFVQGRRKRSSAIIIPMEEFNSTALETIVIATLELRNINSSFTGIYEVTASNHVANATMTFELEVLPYELTSPIATTDVVGGAGPGSEVSMKLLILVVFMTKFFSEMLNPVFFLEATLTG